MAVGTYIPLFDFRMTTDDTFEILDIRGKGKEKSWLDRQLGDITKASAAKQITVGSIAGWCAGFVFTKVGKTAASALAGSLLLFQVAQHQGYVKVNWTRLNRDIEKAKRKLDKHTKKQIPWFIEESHQFVQENAFLATGFAGGFLLGLATS